MNIAEPHSRARGGKPAVGLLEQDDTTGSGDTPPAGSGRATNGLAYSAASANTVQAMPAPGACHYRGTGLFAQPDPHCAPGALNPAVTQQNIGRTICRPGGYTASVRPPERVTEPEKRALMAAYGNATPLSGVELDHVVSLAAGGAANDPRNFTQNRTIKTSRPTASTTTPRIGSSSMYTIWCARGAFRWRERKRRSPMTGRRRTGATSDERGDDPRAGARGARLGRPARPVDERVPVGAENGPWQEADVREVVRKLWHAGELSRREDGTFVQSGQRARDSRYRLELSESAAPPGWTRRSGRSPRPASGARLRCGRSGLTRRC